MILSVGLLVLFLCYFEVISAQKTTAVSKTIALPRTFRPHNKPNLFNIYGTDDIVKSQHESRVRSSSEERNQNVALQVVSTLDATEKTILKEFYTATRGEAWTWDKKTMGDRWNFTANSDPCQDHWFGVVCSCNVGTFKTNFTYSGNAYYSYDDIMTIACHVTKIALSGINLDGTIPSSFSGLSYLTHLHLMVNALRGSIPSSLSVLTNLKILSLYGNSLASSIPTEFGLLTNLEYLNLASNSLGPQGGIPTSFGNLINLIGIFLESNSLNGVIPSVLQRLTGLQYLSLGINGFSRTIPSGLCNLTNLQYLDLSGNLLSGTIPTEIGKLVKLTQIFLGDNYFGFNQSIPSEIGYLTNLVELDVSQGSSEHSSIYKLSSKVPYTIQNLVKLKSLKLNGNLLTGQVYSYWVNMRDLIVFNFGNNKFQGGDITSLCDLPNLRSVLLSDSSLCYPSCLSSVLISDDLKNNPRCPEGVDIALCSLALPGVSDVQPIFNASFTYPSLIVDSEHPYPQNMAQNGTISVLGMLCYVLI